MRESGLGFIERHIEPLIETDCPDDMIFTMPEEVEGVLNQIDSKAQIVLVIPPVLCESVVEIKGFAVIDGNQWPGAKDPSNYYDDHHLIADGAKSYSGWLAEKLILLSAEPSL